MFDLRIRFAKKIPKIYEYKDSSSGEQFCITGHSHMFPKGKLFRNATVSYQFLIILLVTMFSIKIDNVRASMRKIIWID